jgi:hypothetical protein
VESSFPLPLRTTLPRTSIRRTYPIPYVTSRWVSLLASVKDNWKRNPHCSDRSLLISNRRGMPLSLIHYLVVGSAKCKCTSYPTTLDATR